MEPNQYMVHRKLKFYESPEYFYLIPVEEERKQMLLINRHNEEISVRPYDTFALSGTSLVKVVMGVYGVIRLIGGLYMVLITEAYDLGHILPGHSLFRVSKVELVPVACSEMHLSDAQRAFNRQYLSMLDHAFHSLHFYFSYTYLISHNVQSMSKLDIKHANCLIEVSEQQFVWNWNLLQPLVTVGGEALWFALPVICGFVHIHREVVRHCHFTWTLISRRSWLRAGTRLFSRGIDHNGEVSNFIETEQVVHSSEPGSISSWVQLRGSIPVHWNQYPNLRYKPSFRIASTDHLNSYGKHVRALNRRYGLLCAVNLVGTRGGEGRLSKAYQEVVLHGNFQSANDIPFLNLENFDFHHECKRGWHALGKLINNISSYMDDFCYYRPSGGLTQRGVMRINCVDSLDRTNVVQTILARKVLRQQLLDASVLHSSEYLEDYPALDSTLRNVWADHADVCSTQYAGTPALKSDFTRTGQRRLAGILADGLNSMLRYFKNNFEDGFRQDAIDLLTGRYQVRPGEGKHIPCPLERRNLLKIFAMPLVFLVSLSMLLFTLLVVIPYDASSLSQSYPLLFWASGTILSALIMWAMGHDLADYPTLVPIGPTR